MNTLADTLAYLLGRRNGTADLSGLPSHLPVLGVSRLASKKNEVYLLQAPEERFILKVFDSDRWEWEHSILLSCKSKGVLAPRPLLSGERFIVMEFLEGPNLRDLINQTLDPIYSRRLAEWLAIFHRSFVKEEETLVRSDAKLQNFILTERGIAGLDFEMAHWGNPLEDLGEVCAHILNTDPMFIREKYDLCDVLLDRYAFLTARSLNGINGWVLRAMEEAMAFRPHQREVLLREIEKLKKGTLWPFRDIDQNR
jgi:predicted Ser/Thr protein kinase